MRLADFLKREGTDKDLAELILFLGRQSLVVKKGFSGIPGKSAACEKTHNVYGEEQMPLDK
jgi:fructose-1,6-bisphosphatase I